MATAIHPTAIFPSSTAPLVRMRVPEEYTSTGLVLKFFEEKGKDIAKALNYLAFWTGQAIPNLPSEVKSFSAAMGNFKNFVSATEVPKKGYEWWNSLGGMTKPSEDFTAALAEKFYNNNVFVDLTNETGAWNAVNAAGAKLGVAARNIFEKTTSLINASVDSIDFGSNFMPINASVMSWLKGINSVATIGGAGSGAIKQIEKLAATSENDTSKRVFHMVNLARDASYVAVGVLGLVAAFGAVSVSPWMFVACLTSGLSCTIGGYFYERIYDPEGKGKNINPDAVLANRAVVL